jgi:hypothetical protein
MLCLVNFLAPGSGSASTTLEIKFNRFKRKATIINAKNFATIYLSAFARHPSFCVQENLFDKISTL